MAELRDGDLNDPDQSWEDFANGSLYLKEPYGASAKLLIVFLRSVTEYRI